MRRWHKIKRLEYSGIQKKLDNFVDRVKELQQRLEVESRKLSEMSQPKNGVE